MAKINNIINQQVNRINLYTRDFDLSSQKEKRTPDVIQESVISDVKPEINLLDASSIASNIAERLQSEKQTALDAQGALDENRIMALLSDDEE